MAQYIPLEPLVAEINRQQRKLCLLGQSHEVELCKSAAIQNGVYCFLLSFIDTLEVKEVDLEKEIESEYNPTDGLPFEEFARIAKHFYELGVKAKGE